MCVLCTCARSHTLVALLLLPLPKSPKAIPSHPNYQCWHAIKQSASAFPNQGCPNKEPCPSKLAQSVIRGPFGMCGLPRPDLAGQQGGKQVTDGAVKECATMCGMCGMLLRSQCKLLYHLLQHNMAVTYGMQLQSFDTLAAVNTDHCDRKTRTTGRLVSTFPSHFHTSVSLTHTVVPPTSYTHNHAIYLCTPHTRVHTHTESNIIYILNSHVSVCDSV